MLLAPSLLLHTPPAAARTGAKAAVSHLCDYIDANLTRKITLTDLEKISGFSARALQYSFQSVTGQTPGKWISNRRLEVAHTLIIKAEPGATVTEIAGPYFNNMGEFARLYRARYGELPSETLRRR
ncbi:helix-turn-helix transcriptional regulator [Rhizobiales bacterium Sp-1]|uniref:Helix-turn-helix transcriptional regulator n=2 Tax=Segnochrobactrum spirostomi TaxID=2608987 RepID=A0A6A7Y5N7_9HYPH|nr:helix-turn-helix transcriptional regulator [Segnochrobactrum spirostomi]